MTAQPPPPPPPIDEAPPPGGPGVAHFFDRIRRYGAVRPDDGRWFAGGASGLGRRWAIGPLLIRGAFIILAIFGGVGLLLYGLGWLFLPHPDGRIHAQEVLRGVVTPGFIGGLILVLADLGTSGWGRGGWYGPHPFGGGLLFVALIVLGIWCFAGGRRARRGRPGGPGSHGSPDRDDWHGGGWHGRGWQGGGWGGPGTPGPSGGSAPSGVPTPEPGAPGREEPGPATTGDGDRDVPPYGTPPSASASSWSSSTGWSAAPTAVLAPPVPSTPPWTRRPDHHRPSPALTSIVVGLALLAAAVVVAVNALIGGSAPVLAVAAGVALAVVGLGVVATGLSGRRAGALAPLGILLALVTIAAGSTRGPVSWAGQRTWTPSTLTGTTSYQLGVGNARLDLRGVTAPGATPASPAEVDVRVGVGNLVVVVPSGVGVRVVGAGAVGGIQNAAGLAQTPDGTG